MASPTRTRGIHITDNRLAEADRILTRLEREGVHPDAARELLPALLSSDEHMRDRAENWLRENAAVGIGDLSDDSQAERRALQAQARALNADLAGSSDLPGGYRQRFHASDSDLDERLTEASNDPGYPGGQGNRERLAKSAAYTEMERKHGTPAIHIDDSGRVFVTDPHSLRLRQIDKVNLPSDGRAPLTFAQPQHRYGGGQREFGSDLSHESESAYGSGVNRPFFEYDL